MKKTVLASTICISLFSSSIVNAHYNGAHEVGENMRSSVDEMITTKLKASFFDSAALYMDATNVKQLKTSPSALLTSLTTGSQNTQLPLETRQELIDASQEVGFVVDYLKKNPKTQGVDKEVMDFCIAENIEAKDWPGIDYVVDQYGSANSITTLPVSIIYFALKGECQDPSNWANKLTKNTTKSDFESSIPSEIIAYSSSVGNSGGELVYILENSYNFSDDPEEQYESFTFYQTSSDDTPGTGLFRRAQVKKDSANAADSFSKYTNVVCQKCNSDDEKFKVESRAEFGYGTVSVASSAVESGGKLIPGFVSENSTETEYFVQVNYEAKTPNQTTSLYIDAFKFEDSLIHGRYYHDGINGVKFNAEQLKATNLVGEFSLSKPLYQSNVHSSLEVKTTLTNNSYAILKKSDSSEVIAPVTVTDAEDVQLLNEISKVTAEAISYDNSDVILADWNKIY
ncbi:hypothetical protein Q5H80_05520 [Vibrio sp. SNU_ST1]|uniref:hypothetical protein n=1 Tax=Vibrio sp. SNU_ST1 TaxID=3064001 RepID=UPI00272A3677|nr:hypothetical protein [Vibrio sp. SNU_ST1]WKY59093.1 hypothetical protein Q5H80_05520 [Vibrio sp. SNU_ST1]